MKNRYYKNNNYFPVIIVLVLCILLGVIYFWHEIYYFLKFFFCKIVFSKEIIGATIGALIGGAFSIIILTKQLKNINKQNIKSTISANYPLLTYSFESRNPSEDELCKSICLCENNQNKKNLVDYGWLLTIENCGLNLAKNIQLQLNILDGNEILDSDRSFIKSDQIIIKKDEYITINIIASLEKNFSSRNCELICSYDDILGYSYTEKVIFIIKPCQYHGSSTIGYPVFCRVEKIVPLENPLLSMED